MLTTVHTTFWPRFQTTLMASLAINNKISLEEFLLSALYWLLTCDAEGPDN